MPIDDMIPDIDPTDAVADAAGDAAEGAGDAAGGGGDAAPAEGGGEGGGEGDGGGDGEKKEPDVPKVAEAKSRSIVRWPVAIVTTGLTLGYLIFGLGPTIRFVIEKAGSAALGAPVSTDAVSFNVFTGSMAVDLSVAMDPASKKDDGTYEDQIFSADEVTADISMASALKGYVLVEEMRLVGAKGRATRDADGSINLGDAAASEEIVPEPEQPPAGVEPGTKEWLDAIEEKAKDRDFVEDIKKLLKKLKEMQEKEAEERRKREQEARDRIGDPDAYAEWLRQQRPKVHIKKMVAEGMTIVLEDDTVDGPPVELADCAIEIRNLSSAPSLVEEPVGIDIEFNVRAQLLDAFVRNTIPVTFGEKTNLNVKSTLLWHDDWTIDWRPQLTLSDIDAHPRSGESIMGFNAEQFCRALNEIGTLEVVDIHVTGKPWSPEVDMGKTLSNLVLRAIKKMGEKVIDEGLSRAQTEAAAQIDELKGDLGGKIDEKIGEKVGGGVGDKLKDATGGILGGTKDKTKDATGAAGDALKKGLGGMFGGDDKDEDD